MLFTTLIEEDSGNVSAVVTLLADVERTNELGIKIDCTLDLGGHSYIGLIGKLSMAEIDQKQNRIWPIVSGMRHLSERVS